jgi:hypothetical protein
MVSMNNSYAVGWQSPITQCNTTDYEVHTAPTTGGALANVPGFHFLIP